MDEAAGRPGLGDIGRLGLATRRVKVGILQARRLAAWAREPGSWRPAPMAPLADDRVLYEVAVEIAQPGAHPRLEAGKLRNLRLAAARIHGRSISAAHPFSFWRCVGRLTRERGFDVGAEVRAGCVVPTVGGGVCLLSGALFEMAVRLGWTILERHGHTISTRPVGDRRGDLDATLFWPQVDLRFAPPTTAARLRVEVQGGALIVGASGQPSGVTVAVRREELAGAPDFDAHRLVRIVTGADGTGRQDVVAISHKRRRPADALGRTCLTCDEQACQARDGLLRNVR
ncbi:MAG TPA: VanW family protein [Kofleriaceae bacterium]|nr:VanW family protein [Kofleriaceae bacterium]